MVKSHKELAEFIAGKKVLLLNSLGKDSIACLHWLATFASCDVLSLSFIRIASHPQDYQYLNYLRERYKNVTFLEEPNPWEMNDLSCGVFQSPVSMLMTFSEWEHYGFDYNKMADNIALEFACDYVCVGHSRYESVARASNFHNKGILQGNRIYPIGMFSKSDVLELLRGSGTKLHPCYKLTSSTYDRPSYYKMRSAFLANPEYKQKMYSMYPLLALDEYRYEELLKCRN